MPKFTHTCKPFTASPFTFWVTRPAESVGSMDCGDCAAQKVDWIAAAPDEEHGNSTSSFTVGDGGAFSTRDYVRGLAMNYLLSDAEADVKPDCVDLVSRRGWWMDDWMDDGFRLGSKLWSLQWERTTNETLVRARQYAEEAMRPLVDQKVASGFSVSARYAGANEIVLEIEVRGPWTPIGFTLRGVEHPPYGFLWREVRDA